MMILIYIVITQSITTCLHHHTSYSLFTVIFLYRQILEYLQQENNFPPNQTTPKEKDNKQKSYIIIKGIRKQVHHHTSCFISSNYGWVFYFFHPFSLYCWHHPSQQQVTSLRQCPPTAPHKLLHTKPIHSGTRCRFLHSCC